MAPTGERKIPPTRPHAVNSPASANTMPARMNKNKSSSKTTKPKCGGGRASAKCKSFKAPRNGPIDDVAAAAPAAAQAVAPGSAGAAVGAAAGAAALNEPAAHGGSPTAAGGGHLRRWLLGFFHRHLRRRREQQHKRRSEAPRGSQPAGRSTKVSSMTRWGRAAPRRCEVLTSAT